MKDIGNILFKLLFLIALSSASKEEARDRYIEEFKLESKPEMGWTGNLSRDIAGDLVCNSGTVSDSWNQATLERLNYYRHLSGLNDAELGDRNKNCQDVALESLSRYQIIYNQQPWYNCNHGDIVNEMLNLTGSTTWYRTGYNAIDSYMNGETASLFTGDLTPDIIVNLTFQRRHILQPGRSTFSTGDSYSYNFLYLGHELDTTTPQQAYTSWPPSGYVPYRVLPWTNTWYFSRPNTDFTNATVTVTIDDVNVNVTTSVLGNIPEPGIEWSLKEHVNNSASDQVVHVSISGMVGCDPSETNYKLTVFEPFQGRNYLGRYCSEFKTSESKLPQSVATFSRLNRKIEGKWVYQAPLSHVYMYVLNGNWIIRNYIGSVISILDNSSPEPYPTDLSQPWKTHRGPDTIKLTCQKYECAEIQVSGRLIGNICISGSYLPIADHNDRPAYKIESRKSMYFSWSEVSQRWVIDDFLADTRTYGNVRAYSEHNVIHPILTTDWHIRPKYTVDTKVSVTCME